MHTTNRPSPRNLAVVWNSVSDPVDLEIDADGRIRPIQQEEPAPAPRPTRTPRELSFEAPTWRWD